MDVTIFLGFTLLMVDITLLTLLLLLHLARATTAPPAAYTLPRPDAPDDSTVAVSEQGEWDGREKEIR